MEALQQPKEDRDTTCKPWCIDGLMLADLPGDHWLLLTSQRETSE